MTALHSPRFVRFLLAGGVAAAINFGARIILSHWLSFPIAIVLSSLLGLTTAFVLNRQFVFAGSAKPLGEQMFWFVAVNALALGQTLLISLLLANYALPLLGLSWHPEEIAHALGIIAPIFTSYIGHKRVSFSPK